MSRLHPNTLARKILKRVEELVADAGALQVTLVPQWGAIVNDVSKLVAFGIPVSPPPLPMGFQADIAPFVPVGSSLVNLCGRCSRSEALLPVIRGPCTRPPDCERIVWQ